MNSIINKFLLTRDKLMTELHSKQPGFIYSACRSFTKHCETIRKCREAGNLKDIYRNELERTCFSYVAAYFDNQDFTKRTILDKILKDRANEITRNVYRYSC